MDLADAGVSFQRGFDERRADAPPLPIREDIPERTRAQLLETGSKLLDVDEGLLSMTLDEMIRVGDVKISSIPSSPAQEQQAEETDSQAVAIYLPPFFFSETGTARRLAAISGNSGAPFRAYRKPTPFGP